MTTSQRTFQFKKNENENSLRHWNTLQPVCSPLFEEIKAEEDGLHVFIFDGWVVENARALHPFLQTSKELEVKDNDTQLDHEREAALMM